MLSTHLCVRKPACRCCNLGMAEVWKGQSLSPWLLMRSRSWIKSPTHECTPLVSWVIAFGTLTNHLPVYRWIKTTHDMFEIPSSHWHELAVIMGTTRLWGAAQTARMISQVWYARTMVVQFSFHCEMLKCSIKSNKWRSWGVNNMMELQSNLLRLFGEDSPEVTCNCTVRLPKLTCHEWLAAICLNPPPSKKQRM